MLVLSRKLGERIHIGVVVLTVLKVQGGRVRLGMDAPCDVHILRGELHEQTQDEEPVAQGKPRAK